MKPLIGQQESNRKYQETRRRMLGISTSTERTSLAKSNFIVKATDTHNNRYDYVLVDYVNSHTPVVISCPFHGNFKQAPTSHMSGQGCPKCAHDRRVQSRKRKTTSEFINEANMVHSDRYIYVTTSYINIKTKVLITCLDHGDFMQTPKAHLSGQGCPDCANIKRASFFESKGEKEIEQYLVEHAVTFVKQKTFPDCKHEMLLRFDFYLPHRNMLVEYDGEQHYNFTPKFHGTVAGFLTQQLRDSIKTEYANTNHIPLIRIKWNQDVVDILTKVLVG